MSCDVASSPFSDSVLDTTFDSKSGRHGVDLSAIHEFNSNFTNSEGQGPLDFSNANLGLFGLDQTYTPDPSMNLHSDFCSSPESPYNQSIEQSPAPFIPPALRHQYSHRRSVSEPPDGGMLHYRPQNPDGGVIFHRDGHKLGVPAPISSYAPPAKRVKPSRVQPYGGRKPTHSPQNQNRYQIRRSHTQSYGKPPTSMPPAAIMQDTLPMPHFGFKPSREAPRFAVSRVCTPAPEAVDPMLVMPTLPPAAVMTFQTGSGEWRDQNIPSGAPVQRAVVIKMSAEELRALMTEVVQKVFDEALVQRPNNVNGVYEGHEGTDTGDEIVVAGESGQDVVVESMEEEHWKSASDGVIRPG